MTIYIIRRTIIDCVEGVFFIKKATLTFPNGRFKIGHSFEDVAIKHISPDMTGVYVMFTCVNDHKYIARGFSKEVEQRDEINEFIEKCYLEDKDVELLHKIINKSDEILPLASA
jgi:hypothetical protein